MLTKFIFRAVPRTTFARQPLHHLSRPLTTTARLRLKEDENRSPQHVDNKKQQSVNKAEKGTPEWDEKLGSVSEGQVKADQQAEEVQDHDHHMKKLQDQTAGKAEDGKI